MTRRRLFKVGARGSRLSRAQTRAALAFLRREFPGTAYRAVPFATPGDRDLATPIERAAPDFFTRDLDDAVRDGRIDFAVHSAKDLPSPVPDGLDWFWLPLREDPRDALVTRRGAAAVRRIGVSSARRADYARRTFPRAAPFAMRGAVDARLEQIMSGACDAAILALAGLNRLFAAFPALRRRAAAALDITPIPVEDLPPPEAQGVLAVVFKAGNPHLMALRTRFVKAVRFTSAGVGRPDLCTLAGLRDIESADIVLNDALSPFTLHSSPFTSFTSVGKRCGAHTVPQEAITRLICDEARKGKRVVRLKGGDAGLFGRLAEETDALAALRLPFLVRPGVSALTAATTGTGILLTRRGEARGFTVETPRSTGAETPRVLFMSVSTAAAEARRMMADGAAADTPCAIVFDAAGPREEVVRLTLDALARRTAAADETRPGLIVVGRAAARTWPALGEWGGRRILLTCSDAVQARAARTVEDKGGRPIPWPLIRLVPRADALAGRDPERYDAIVLTSPSAVRIFFSLCTCDRRRLPEFFTCGAGTDAELRTFGVASDVRPAANFSARGLIKEIRSLDLRGRRVLRLRSAKAGADVARALAKAGARVDDVVLYDNVPCAPDGDLPSFDDVFFASASAVEAFLARYGAAALRGKGILTLGAPTRAALPPALARAARGGCGILCA